MYWKTFVSPELWSGLKKCCQSYRFHQPMYLPGHLPMFLVDHLLIIPVDSHPILLVDHLPTLPEAHQSIPPVSHKNSVRKFLKVKRKTVSLTLCLRPFFKCREQYNCRPFYTCQGFCCVCVI